MLHVFSYQYNSHHEERNIYVHLFSATAYPASRPVGRWNFSQLVIGSHTGPRHNRGTHNHCLLHSQRLPVSCERVESTLSEQIENQKHVNLVDVRHQCKLPRRLSSSTSTESRTTCRGRRSPSNVSPPQTLQMDEEDEEEGIEWKLPHPNHQDLDWT